MSEHIFIADDDPDIVQFVSVNLELEGYDGGHRCRRIQRKTEFEAQFPGFFGYGSRIRIHLDVDRHHVTTCCLELLEVEVGIVHHQMGIEKQLRMRP